MSQSTATLIDVVMGHRGIEVGGKLNLPARGLDREASELLPLRFVHCRHKDHLIRIRKSSECQVPECAYTQPCTVKAAESHVFHTPSILFYNN
jgi:hypothetical protein